MASGVGFEVRTNADGAPPHLLPRQETRSVVRTLQNNIIELMDDEPFKERFLADCSAPPRGSPGKNLQDMLDGGSNPDRLSPPGAMP